MRAALVQTVNVYPLPARREDLTAVASLLPAIARANVDHHLTLLGEAAFRGAQAVCLGELFPAPYFALDADPMWRGLAEDAENGETVTRLRGAAARLRLVVVAPIYERAPDGRRFNTAVVIDASGRILGKYRKNHIPEGSNEQGTFHEKTYYEPGVPDAGPGGANVSRNPFFPVFQTQLGRIGVALCYDRHFEGVFSTLSAEGAQLVFCPAVSFGEKSRRLWRQEFAVEAARHRLFIGASNRKGAEPPWGQEYYGESHFVGPDGPISDLSDHPNLVIADVDLDGLSRPDPAGWDLRRDRRPGIYGAGKANG